MPNCCSYDEVFSSKVARADLRRYRRRGLDPVAGRMVGFLVGAGIEGRSVLEVGGGVGMVHIELLKAGARSAIGVEMSSGYEQVAGELLEEEGLSDRVERLVLDFAMSGDRVGGADAVVMNRVICCYPDMPRLLGAALDKAGRLIAISFPRPRRSLRIGVRLINLVSRLRRTDFRAFVHSPSDVMRMAQDRGFGAVFDTQTFAWQGVVFERSA
ncbi:MAG TPA: methyltransferase domain-containing protein [Acidimicrobiia bacterium]